jgi:hypothetical protein
MMPVGSRLYDEASNDSEFPFEPAIVRQVEMQGNRTRQHGALNDVQSERRAAAVDQHVLAGRATDDAAGLSDHFEAAVIPAFEG